jgi:hypothetical protein
MISEFEKRVEGIVGRDMGGKPGGTELWIISLDIAMTLSWTRSYPDPTRCRVGPDLSRVPVRSSWAGLMNTLVGSGYLTGSGK